MATKFHEESARRIIDFYQAHDNDETHTINHFVEQGLVRRTIKRVIKRWVDEGRVSYKWNHGRKRKVLRPATLKKVKNKFIKNPSASGRKVASELKISETSVRRAKGELKIKTRKKIVAPLYKNNQEKRAKSNAWKLYKRLIAPADRKIVVMDDETYVLLDPHQAPGNRYYNEAEDHPLDIDQKLRPKEKFPAKFLVWQAIASTGEVSESFITKGTINQEIYRTKCLPKLIKFIRKLGGVKRVLFWPDMASAHYASSVTDHLENLEIDYVLKCDNLPNVPQLRPIERYWALCKVKYRRFNTVTKTIPAFRSRWTNISREVSGKSGKLLFNKFLSRLAKVGQQGVKSVL